MRGELLRGELLWGRVDAGRKNPPRMGGRLTAGLHAGRYWLDKGLAMITPLPRLICRHSKSWSPYLTK